MTSDPGNARGRKRHEHDVARRRSAAQHSAAKAQRELEERRRYYRNRQRRRVIAFCMFGLAAVIAVSHVLEHAGAFQLLSPGWQDLLLGYPMAGVLAIAGGIVLGK